MIAPHDWLRPDLRELAAYRVADASGLVKLDAMENPHPFPSELREAWLECLREVQLNRYPDPDAMKLKSRLREAMGMPPDTALMLGNGSDEILQILMLAAAGPGRCLVTPEPGFAMFRIIARLAGLEYVGVPLREDFSLDADAMVAAYRRHEPALAIFAQPNNPTGNRYDAAALRAAVDAAPCPVVIDEAYYPFADGDHLDWLREDEDLLIMRTVSKLGLAGLRLGFLAGPARWIDALAPLRLPYNVNALTQASAEFALAHIDAFESQAADIRGERERLYGILADWSAVAVYPSEANFLLVRMPTNSAEPVHAGLRERGVLVKNLHGSHPALVDCIRITVGTAAENDHLLGALGDVLAETVTRA